MKIIKQELQFEECLKQGLEFICEFSKVIPIFIINLGKYKLVMFAMTKLMEIETIEQNKATFYWFNVINSQMHASNTLNLKFDKIDISK